MIPLRSTSLIVLDTEFRPSPAPERRGRVIVIGNFDGVHKGHQAVLERATKDAEARDLEAAVLTFDPHPSGVLGRPSPPLLTTLERRAELIGRCGIHTIFVRPFDQAFSNWSPFRFVDELLLKTLGATQIVVGANFRFGCGRAGNLAVLREIAAPLKIEAQVTTLLRDAKGPYSSTRAREALERGDLSETEEVLGRRHSFAGRVGAGAGRGRTVGFPTANVEAIAELIPMDGVYAVVVDLIESGGARALARGVMNIGIRPTFEENSQRSVEIHLLDHQQDLYGKWLRTHVVQRLRGERKFANVASLRAQIESDVEEARTVTRSVTSVKGVFG